MQVNDHAIAPGVNQMNRVLLTGVTGYIGQHCAAELLRQGYEVVGTIRSRAKADSTRIAIAKVAPVDRLQTLLDNTA
jgi:dihydroflavonol-4-reductase